jgi:hypothetical protein
VEEGGRCSGSSSLGRTAEPALPDDEGVHQESATIISIALDEREKNSAVGLVAQKVKDLDPV